MPLYFEKINGDVDRPTNRPTNQPGEYRAICLFRKLENRKKAEICNKSFLTSVPAILPAIVKVIEMKPRSLERRCWDGFLVHNQLQPPNTLLSTYPGILKTKAKTITKTITKTVKKTKMERKIFLSVFL